MDQFIFNAIFLYNQICVLVKFIAAFLGFRAFMVESFEIIKKNVNFGMRFSNVL